MYKFLLFFLTGASLFAESQYSADSLVGDYIGMSMHLEPRGVTSQEGSRGSILPAPIVQKTTPAPTITSLKPSIESNTLGDSNIRMEVTTELKVELKSYTDNAALAYGKGKDSLTSMRAKKDSYNLEQLDLLSKAEELQIKLKDTYDKTIESSEAAPHLEKKDGSSGIKEEILYYDTALFNKTEKLSKQTVDLYEEIKAINDQILALSNETLNKAAPVTGFAPLSGATAASSNPTTVTIIPVAAVSPQPIPVPVDGIVESINDTIINDVVNVVPPVITPEVPVVVPVGD